MAGGEELDELSRELAEFARRDEHESNEKNYSPDTNSRLLHGISWNHQLSTVQPPDRHGVFHA